MAPAQLVQSGIAARLVPGRRQVAPVQLVQKRLAVTTATTGGASKFHPEGGSGNR